MSVLDWFRRPTPEPEPWTPPPPPAFCRMCGAALENYREVGGYSEQTGEALYSEWPKCPKADPAAYHDPASFGSPYWFVSGYQTCEPAA